MLNLELVRKYKQEFDYLVNGGSICIRFLLLDTSRDISDELSHWIKTDRIAVEWEEHFKDRGVQVVIADDYLEFRKALVEGKVVEHNIANLGVWHVMKTQVFNDPLTFSDRSLCYRIKPKEPKFKVGDWVGIKSSGSCQLINKILLGNIEHNEWEDNYELWTPTQDKLVVFSDDSIPYIIDKYIMYTDGLHYTSTGKVTKHVYPLEFIHTLKDVK